MEIKSDEEIIKLVVFGNKELFEEIIKRYEKKLFNYVYYLLRDKDKALDVVQETFLKSFINLRGFKKNLKFSSWIYRIAHNEAVNLVKKQKKEFIMPKGFDYKSSEDIEKEFSKEEISKMVRDCLSDISIKYSEPLALFYLEDKSYEEISDILRIPTSTVGVRIKRAKLVLKKLCLKKL